MLSAVVVRRSGCCDELPALSGEECRGPSSPPSLPTRTLHNDLEATERLAHSEVLWRTRTEVPKNVSIDKACARLDWAKMTKWARKCFGGVSRGFCRVRALLNPVNRAFKNNIVSAQVSTPRQKLYQPQPWRTQPCLRALKGYLKSSASSYTPMASQKTACTRYASRRNFDVAALTRCTD